MKKSSLFGDLSCFLLKSLGALCSSVHYLYCPDSFVCCYTRHFPDSEVTTKDSVSPSWKRQGLMHASGGTLHYTGRLILIRINSRITVSCRPRHSDVYLIVRLAFVDPWFCTSYDFELHLLINFLSSYNLLFFLWLIIMAASIISMTRF